MVPFGWHMGNKMAASLRTSRNTKHSSLFTLEQTPAPAFTSSNVRFFWISILKETDYGWCEWRRVVYRNPECFCIELKCDDITEYGRDWSVYKCLVMGNNEVSFDCGPDSVALYLVIYNYVRTTVPLPTEFDVSTDYNSSMIVIVDLNARSQ